MIEIWITRHGQTDWNKAHLMQGRSDIPLNETGISQASEVRKKIGDIIFDKVYASPLQRAIDTASIIGNITKDNIIKDERIIEADFGPYEKKNYRLLGLSMTLYWMAPWLFKVPNGTESLEQMKKRITSFIADISKEDDKRILIVCHGGIMRVLTGVLLGRKSGAKWYPKPHNCEIRIFSLEDKKMLKRIR